MYLILVAVVLFIVYYSFIRDARHDKRVSTTEKTFLLLSFSSFLLFFPSFFALSISIFIHRNRTNKKGLQKKIHCTKIHCQNEQEIYSRTIFYSRTELSLIRTLNSEDYEATFSPSLKI